MTGTNACIVKHKDGLLKCADDLGRVSKACENAPPFCESRLLSGGINRRFGILERVLRKVGPLFG